MVAAEASRRRWALLLLLRLLHLAALVLANTEGARCARLALLALLACLAFSPELLRLPLGVLAFQGALPCFH